MQKEGFSTAPIKAHARKELVDLLDSVRGKKGVVLDPGLSGPLSLIAEFSLLKEHGVEKIYHLSAEHFTTECTSLIYICRPKLLYMKWIAAHIQANTQLGQRRTYSLFFVPRRTLICERVLEEEGVYGELTIGEFHLDLIPLEDDLLSLELDNSFRELYLDGDTTGIFSLAKAVMKLQTMFGIIPRIVGKGQHARAFTDLLLRMRRELVANAEDDIITSSIFPNQSEIDSLIVIDRNVDLVTPLCTQLTYEGLIDEVLGIRSTFVEVEAAAVGAPAPGSTTAAPSNAIQAPKMKKAPLNGSDPLFTQLRDLNFAVVGGLLSQVARRIHDDYEGRHQAKTVSQIKDFMGKFGNLQSEHQALRLHTGIAEKLTTYTQDREFNQALEVQQNFVAGIANKSHIEYVETLIDKQAPLTQTLRLLSLHSMIEGGMKTKYYDAVRRDIVQTYGHIHMLTLQNLAKVGLFRKQEVSSRHNYPQIRKSMRLIVDDVNEHQPNDISYVYSGYAPLSVRLVQAACQKTLGAGTTPPNPGPAGISSHNIGWKGWEEPLKLIPGPMFEEIQKTRDRTAFAKNSKDKSSVTLVVFLGGCTFTEVSALRFLSQQDEGRREFVIATTNMINGNSMIRSLMEKVGGASPSA
ncbi:Sec1-like protein [Powellomyces hirtus]|nr:Sec1-like protein [Powellomyces hirtus]